MPATTIAARVALSARSFVLPDGRTAGFWSLAPIDHPNRSTAYTADDRAVTRAEKAIPAAQRERAFLQAEDGTTVWALVDLRDGTVVVSSHPIHWTPAPALDRVAV